MRGYVGTLFKDMGRTKDGCDCWGLACIVYREQLGIELPTYGDASVKNLGLVARTLSEQQAAAGLFVKVEDRTRKLFDIVLMRRLDKPGRIPVHVGILMYMDRVLHTEQETDAVSIPVKHPSIANRLIGFYRHRSLL